MAHQPRPNIHRPGEEQHRPKGRNDDDDNRSLVTYVVQFSMCFFRFLQHQQQ